MPKNTRLRPIVLALVACVVLGLSASAANADQVFITPVGSTTSGGAVNAQVTFSQTGNVLTVTLQNLQGQVANYDVAQAVSGLGFSIAGVGAATITNQHGEHIDVASNGSFTSSGDGATFWGLSTNSGGNFRLNALGFAIPPGPPTNNPPDELLLGPPNGSNLYTGNGSINGNDPHNPFVRQTITFTLSFASLPSNAQITNVVFFFGTAESNTENVPGTPTTPIPEPATMLLLGTGLVGLGAGIRRWRRK